MSSFSDPAHGLVAITPSDSTDIGARVRAIWVGGDGAVSVLCADNTTAVLSGATAGSIIPIYAKRVNATGTTATNLVGML